MATGSISSPPSWRGDGAFHPGFPLIEVGGAENEAAGEIYAEADSEVVDQIKELIETRVRPAVAQDGGDIIFRGFDGSSGIVSLHLQAPAPDVRPRPPTLKNGIENMLRHYVPEVDGGRGGMSSPGGITGDTAPHHAAHHAVADEALDVLFRTAVPIATGRTGRSPTPC